MGARGKHRAPTVVKPQYELLGWLLVLAPVSGLILAAAREAHQSGDGGWETFFYVSLCVIVFLYFYIATAWVKYWL